MNCAFDNLDAAGFLQIWQHFDADDNGYIEGKELDDFFRHMLKKFGPEDKITEERVQEIKKSFMSAYDITADGRLQIQELANMILPEDENFLLIFRREAPLDNSVDFMKIWRKYDADSSGYISAVELKGFLKDLFFQHKKNIPSSKLDEYTDTMRVTTVEKMKEHKRRYFKENRSDQRRSRRFKMTDASCYRVGFIRMNIFDKNKDGRLDLNDLARILALQENFMLQFKMDASSQGERKRDFEKIFSHYDVSKTGALEGPEVDGFVKDMMELVKPSISGVDLDKFREVLLRHCDVNQDGKLQKSELALCLGLKLQLK